MNVYTGDGAMYTHTVMSLNGAETANTKIKVDFGDDLQSVLDNFAGMASEGAEGIDFFAMTAAELETQTSRFTLTATRTARKSSSSLMTPTRVKIPFSERVPQSSLSEPTIF